MKVLNSYDYFIILGAAFTSSFFRISCGFSNLESMIIAAMMYGLKLAGVDLNRKMLSAMAISDPEGFTKVVEVAKSKIA